VFHYPAHRTGPAPLLDAGFGVVTVAALGVGAVFLVVAAAFLAELGTVATHPLYAVLFLAMSVLGTVGVFLDQVSMAQRRGDQAMARNVANGLATVAPLALIPLVGTGGGSPALFAFWVGGGAAAAVLGLLQLHRNMGGYRLRLRFEADLTRSLVRTGVPNQALTLAERAPAFLLPILVTELLSPAENAYWYAAWMAAWAVTVIPISVGTALFSEMVHSPDELAHHARRALGASLALGVPAALALAVLADPFLSLMGTGYAGAGAAPLRILVLGIVPVSVLHTYYGVCRARPGRLREAIVTAAAGSATGLVASGLAASAWGLGGMAWAWVAGLVPAGLWAAWRLQRLCTVPAAVATSGDPDPAWAVGA
jgi:O-antigen/teichoic acid export membrane protein